MSEKEILEEARYQLNFITEEKETTEIEGYILESLIELIENKNKEIDKLKERNEYLEESDYSWHQLLKIQNKREHRSKFLKEFQAEFGKNVMPDYDEIYKRYDKQKELIKNLKLDNQVLKETLFGGNVSE